MFDKEFPSSISMLLGICGTYFGDTMQFWMFVLRMKKSTEISRQALIRRIKLRYCFSSNLHHGHSVKIQTRPNDFDESKVSYTRIFAVEYKFIFRSWQLMNEFCVKGERRDYIAFKFPQIFDSKMRNPKPFLNRAAPSCWLSDVIVNLENGARKLNYTAEQHPRYKIGDFFSCFLPTGPSDFVVARLECEKFSRYSKTFKNTLLQTSW